MWIEIVHQLESERHKELKAIVDSRSIEAIGLTELNEYNEDRDETEVKVIPKLYTKSGDSWPVYNISYEDLVSIVKSPGNVLKVGGSV